MARRPTQDELTRRSRVRVIPTRCHPAITALFVRMRDEGMPYEMMEDRSGVAVSTLGHWRRGRAGRFCDLEAALNVVGMTLRAVPIPGWGEVEKEAS